MKNFRYYNAALIGMVVAYMLVLVFASRDIQPFTGDLTRLGGYPEKDYGWNTPLLGFENRLFDFANDLSQYNRHYDVIIIGDSFSRDSVFGWQNFLISQTGLSVLTFHVDRLNIDDLVNSPQFRSSPPLAVVYQSVERVALTRLSRPAMQRLPDLTPRTISLAPRNMSRTGPTPIPLTRQTEEKGFVERMNMASNMYMKMFFRDVLGVNITEVATLPLKKAWFSSEKSDEIVFLQSHLLPATLALDRMESALLGARKLKGMIEQNGNTKLYLMFFPNEISVYRDQLQSPEIKVASLMDHFDDFNQDDIVRLDKAFQSALDAGLVDLYLPNDTHTSSVGYKIAAEKLMGKMIEDKLIR